MLSAACNKNKVPNSLYRDIAGKWEYERYVGFGVGNNFQPPGNGNLIILSKDGYFERLRNDTLLFKGTYALKSIKDCPNESHPYFHSVDSDFPDRRISIEESKLVFSSPACVMDGASKIYRRVEWIIFCER